MRDASPDRLLGYGGLALVVIALITSVATFGADPELMTSLVGLAMVGWMIAITVRHFQAYPGGRGSGLLMAAWGTLGLLLAFAIFQAVDTAAFDDGVVDGLLSLAAAPPRVALELPLLLASWAILRDGHAPAGRDREDALSG